MLLKLGRQELVYRDERFIGIGVWSNTGRTFDAVKVRFVNDVLWVDAFSGQMDILWGHHFNEASDSFWLTGVYASSTGHIPKPEGRLENPARTRGHFARQRGCDSVGTTQRYGAHG